MSYFKTFRITVSVTTEPSTRLGFEGFRALIYAVIFVTAQLSSLKLCMRFSKFLLKFHFGFVVICTLCITFFLDLNCS